MPSAYLDFARTVCRRAERSVVTVTKNKSTPKTQSVVYLNRLSDLLWLIARAVDEPPGEQLT